MTMKTCKVICTYFGERRSLNNNATNPISTLEQFEESVKYEESIDPGCHMDTIIINNQAGNHAGNLYIEQFLNGMETKQGKFICHTRENMGGSFGAYDYAYQLYKDIYDYWCFCEDDVMLIKDNYMRDAIIFMEENPEVGFVAFSPIRDNHCGGGFGVTSKKHLKTIAAKNEGHLPFINSNSYFSFEQSEIMFTSIYNEFGLGLINLPNISPLAKNAYKHFSQLDLINSNLGNRNFIYKVGK